MGVFRLPKNQQMVQGFPINRSYTKQEADNKFGGGSTSPLTTKGDLYGFSTVDARIPVGADGEVLTADSTNALGVSWQTLSGFVTGATNTTLTLTGTTLGLNLANANTYTGQQTFNTSATVHGVGVITPKIYPASDSTNAVGIYKANGTTQILYTDTTNGRIGIGSAPTDYNLEVYSPASTNIAMKIWTGSSIFGYTLGRNTGTGFLDITGNQGIFSGIHVDQIRSDGAITINGNAVISNWASTLGIGNGTGTPNGTIEIRSSSNSVPNLSMGSGASSNYNFRRNTATGYLEISGVQAQYTGYLFSTGNYTDVFTLIDGVGAVFNEGGDSVLDFRIESDTDANNFFVDASANANGFGTNAPSAKVHIIKTTEQLRVGYDASNYWSTTVGSTGGVTFDAVGSGASFTFSDNIRLTQTVTTETVTSDTTVTININGTDYKLLAKA